MVDVKFLRMAGPRQAYVPAANSECLCGSGEKFKRCCSGELPGFDIGKKARAAARAGNYPEALVAYRADVTQYSIWHKTNTAPSLAAGKAEVIQGIHDLLIVDVEALADRVGFLGWCYARLNRSNEFPAVLERLRSNISHPRWQRKVTYLQVVETLGPNWNRERGRRELKKLGPMDSEDDVEILQLYIDLWGDQIGLAQRQKLVDRVVQLTRDDAERMHYRVIKAVDYLLVGDLGGAEVELQAAVDAFAEVQHEYENSGYAMDHYARAVSLLGRLKNDGALQDEALTMVRQLLTRDDWTASGRANLLLEQGEILRLKTAWAEAKDTYVAALEEGGQEVCKVFIAGCLLYLDGPAAAQEMLATVVREHLAPSELADYVFTLAVVAIQDGDKSALTNAEQELRQVQLADPYFKDRRDSLLLSVIDTLRSGPSPERAERARGVLRAVFSTLLRYVKLEPNIMGIGLNVGRLLEDHLGDKTRSDAASKKTKP